MKNKIVLTYAWGIPNAGDHALTLGAIELLLLHVPESEIIIISRFSNKNDSKDGTKDILDRYPDIKVLESPFKFSRRTVIDRFLEKIYGFFMLIIVTLFPKISLKIYKNNKALQSIATARLLLCNGGNLFYWNKYRKSFPRLLALGLPFILAKKVGVPYGFLPQTMGTIDNKIIRNYMLSILNSAKFVLFRDKKSYVYMKEYLDKSKTDIKLLQDLAFTVSNDYKEQEVKVVDSLNKLGLNVDEKFIAVTLRASKLGDPEGVTGDNVNKNAIEKVSNYVKEVVIPVAEHRGLNIVVVEQTDVDNDTSHYFQEICQKNFSKNVVYVSSRDPLFLSALYLKSECLVGMRLHSLIFALRVNKPAFAIYLKQFGPKTPGIYSNFELDQYCIDMEEVNPSMCSTQLEKMLTNNETIINSISEILSSDKKLIYEFMKKYINSDL